MGEGLVGKRRQELRRERGCGGKVGKGVNVGVGLGSRGGTRSNMLVALSICLDRC